MMNLEFCAIQLDRCVFLNLMVLNLSCRILELKDLLIIRRHTLFGTSQKESKTLKLGRRENITMKHQKLDIRTLGITGTF